MGWKWGAGQGIGLSFCVSDLVWFARLKEMRMDRDKGRFSGLSNVFHNGLMKMSLWHFILYPICVSSKKTPQYIVVKNHIIHFHNFREKGLEISEPSGQRIDCFPSRSCQTSLNFLIGVKPFNSMNPPQTTFYWSITINLKSNLIFGKRHAIPMPRKDIIQPI